MKRLIVILALTFVCCKNNHKTITHNPSVVLMWANFIKENPEYKTQSIPPSWFFSDNKEDADKLAELTTKGLKKATSSLYSWYEQDNADLPKIGTLHIITDWDGVAKAIIKIKKVDTIPFNKISKEYAKIDVVTEDEPLIKWKKAHWNFFSNELKKQGSEPTKDMLIVCETFDTIWK